jgi:hypothetical protein
MKKRHLEGPRFSESIDKAQIERLLEKEHHGQI